MIEPMDSKTLAEHAVNMLNRVRQLSLPQQVEVLEVAFALVRTQLSRPMLDLQRREIMIKIGALQPELLASPIRDEVA